MDNKNNEYIEVLAPAGGPDALKAAVFAGANAVYMGGPAFGARANAKNFTREQLKEAAEFCHARDVRVHITVNTLLKDSELPEALDLIEYLCTVPVDAVLVQDMGLFELIKERAPKLPVHASTQMSLHTAGGAKLLEQLGSERVVLSREMSLNEIKAVADECPVELESFIHGALCMSVSGQCYFSAMLGGRSGNRGMCAQPCRLPFAAQNGTGHDLSLKDLSFISQVEKLREAGVCSAKIEGRMKRPEYVAAAVSACRRAADGEAVPVELMDNLEAVFSRSGFTDGYLTGKRGGRMFGIRTKEDVTGATEKVFSSLRNIYRAERKSVPISFVLSDGGESLSLSVFDNDGRKLTVTAAKGEGEMPVLTEERCKAQLEKTGGTPFSVENITVPEGGVAAGVSAVNSLRREALEKLLNERGSRTAIEFNSKPYTVTPRENRRTDELPLRAYFRSAAQVPKAALRCDCIALPIRTEPDELLKLREQGFERIFIEQPRAMFGCEDEIKTRTEMLMTHGFNDFIVGNLGGLYIGREAGATMHGAFGLNVFNTAALEHFEKLGLSTAEVSMELTGRELAALGGKLERGLMIYGRQALMLTRNCPLANSPRGCLGCKEPNCLTDRMKKKFPVMCTGAGSARYSEVFNSVPLWLADKQDELLNIDFGIARFTVENSVECGEIISTAYNAEMPAFDYTRGLFSRGVE